MTPNNTTIIVFTIGLVFGISLQSLYSVSYNFIIWSLFISLILAILMWRFESREVERKQVFLFSLFLFALAFGIVRTDIYTWRFQGSSLVNFLNQKVSLVGVVWREPEYNDKRLRLVVKSGTDLILVTTDRLQEINYGDKITISGKLTSPKNFTTELGREFDYQNYLRAQKINYLISFAKITVTGEHYGNFFLEKLFSIKKIFIENIQTAIPPPASGLGLGLLLGVKSALGEEVDTNFRRSGLTHIVVLSGYNVMLIVTFISAFLAFFVGRIGRILLGLLAIIIFALLVGLSATVMRASIMAGLVILSSNLGRDYNVWRALWLAGLVMIMFNPYLLLFDLGFQLSFVATIGLIMIVPKFESTIITSKTKQIFDWQSLLKATIATQLAVLPLLIFYTGEISLISVLTNILVLPVVPIAMLTTFITGLFGFWEPLSIFVGYGAYLVLTYILLVAEKLSNLSYATLALPKSSLWWVLVLYLTFGWLWFFHTRKKVSLKGSKLLDTNYLSDWSLEDEDKVRLRLKSNTNFGVNKKSDLPKFFK